MLGDAAARRGEAATAGNTSDTADHILCKEISEKLKITTLRDCGTRHSEARCPFLSHALQNWAICKSGAYRSDA